MFKVRSVAVGESTDYLHPDHNPGDLHLVRPVVVDADDSGVGVEAKRLGVVEEPVHYASLVCSGESVARSDE